MNIQLIIAAVIALGGFGSAWKLQDWRYGAKENERVQQQLNEERLSAKKAMRQSERVIEAQSAAQVRVIALRRDVDGARSESERLRASRDEALRIASTSHAACTERITAFDNVLGTVEAAGRAVSEKADRHANDVQTLIAAWPTNKE